MYGARRVGGGPCRPSRCPSPAPPLLLGPGMLGRPARPPASPGPPQRERPLRCGRPPAPGAVSLPRVLRGPPWWIRTGRESRPHVCSEHHEGSGQQKQTRRWETPCPPCARGSPAPRCSEVLRASWSPLGCRSPPWLARCWPAPPLRTAPPSPARGGSAALCGPVETPPPPPHRPGGLLLKGPWRAPACTPAHPGSWGLGLAGAVGGGGFWLSRGLHVVAKECWLPLN